MKQIIKWVALDGEEFETKEECCEHEKPIYEFRNFMIKNVSMYDSEHRDLLEGLNIEDDENDFCNIIDHAYNRAQYITIRADMSNKIADHIHDSMGFYIPEKTGTYRYDNISNRWCSFGEDIKKLAKLWDVKLQDLKTFITAL